jgi:hypothetical protein
VVEREIPSPLRRDVVVIVLMKDGGQIESPPMPPAVASEDAFAIKRWRDQAHDQENYDRPDWLPSDFDYSQIATVDTEPRDPA